MESLGGTERFPSDSVVALSPSKVKAPGKLE